MPIYQPIKMCSHRLIALAMLALLSAASAVAEPAEGLVRGNERHLTRHAFGCNQNTVNIANMSCLLKRIGLTCSAQKAADNYLKQNCVKFFFYDRMAKECSAAPGTNTQDNCSWTKRYTACLEVGYGDSDPPSPDVIVDDYNALENRSGKQLFQTCKDRQFSKAKESGIPVDGTYRDLYCDPSEAGC